MKKPIIVLLMGLVVVFTSAQVFAESGHEERQRGVAAGEERPIEVDNKICPVRGHKIKEEEAYKFEFEGKIYNLCCPMCIEEFEKDPQGHIKKLG